MTQRAVTDPRLGKLRRMKRLALAALIGSAALYVASVPLADAYPVFAYVAAFAGAAMVGGLADWFAVSALFRHPLGIRLPHTAVVPRNQARIADSLGRFVRTRLLSEAGLAAVIKQLAPASRLLVWAAAPEQTAEVAQSLARVVHAALVQGELTPLRSLLRLVWVRALEQADLPGAVGKVLETVTERKAWRPLLVPAIARVHAWIASEREDLTRFLALHIQLPATFQLDERAARALLKRLEQVLGQLESDLVADSQHPLYGFIDAELQVFCDRLQTDEDARAPWLEAQRAGLAAGAGEPGFDKLWSILRGQAVDVSAATLTTHIQRWLQVGLAALAEDGRLAASLDRKAVDWLPRLVAEHGMHVADFIALQVRSWDPGFLARELELNLGSDLQFIRLNGTLVGGLVGVVIHLCTQLWSHGAISH